MRRQCWMIVLAGMMSYFNPERALGAPQREVSQSRGATLSPPPYVVILISCSGLVSFVLLLLACLCCKRGGVGFNEFDNAEGEECSGASSPPPEDSLSSCPSLPEVYTLPLRDRAICPAIQDNTDGDSHCFRRHTLNYLQEIGNGWFGKVILAEVLCDCSSSQAVVKELRVSASPLEQRKFLAESEPYRSLQHPNILQCLGQCSESIPYLLVMEFCQLGDLKRYLRAQRKSDGMTPDLLTRDLLTLQRMAFEITSGLLHLHENNYIHSDLALRNCLLTSDLTVRIGDYGLSHNHYKEDYYLTPDKLWIPLRWIAPELLEEFRGGLIVTDQTKTSNVWSLGVVIWELFEFGSQPHRHLSDEEVLTFVIRERQITLAQPRLKLAHADYWYEVMQSCWLPPSQRPSVAEIFLLLSSLLAAERRMCRRSVGEEDEDEVEDEEGGGRGRRGESDESFERRWDSLRPPAFQAAASERQREREREREEGGCRGANGNSFPLLDPVGNTIAPSSSELDDILTVTETSKGLNFEYFWEKAHGRRGYKPLPPPQPIPTANSTHRHSLDTPTVVPVISARSPSLASEYYIRLEEHTPQDKSPALKGKAHSLPGTKGHHIMRSDSMCPGDLELVEIRSSALGKDRAAFSPQDEYKKGSKLLQTVRSSEVQVLVPNTGLVEFSKEGCNRVTDFAVVDIGEKEGGVEGEAKQKFPGSSLGPPAPALPPKPRSVSTSSTNYLHSRPLPAPPLGYHRAQGLAHFSSSSFPIGKMESADPPLMSNCTGSKATFDPLGFNRPRQTLPPSPSLSPSIPPSSGTHPLFPPPHSPPPPLPPHYKLQRGPYPNFPGDAYFNQANKPTVYSQRDPLACDYPDMKPFSKGMRRSQSLLNSKDVKEFHCQSKDAESPIRQDTLYPKMTRSQSMIPKIERECSSSPTYSDEDDSPFSSPTKPHSGTAIKHIHLSDDLDPATSELISRGMRRTQSRLATILPAIWQEDAELLKEGVSASKKSPMHLFLTEISNVSESRDTKFEDSSWDLGSDSKGECQKGGERAEPLVCPTQGMRRSQSLVTELGSAKQAWGPIETQKDTSDVLRKGPFQTELFLTEIDSGKMDAEASGDVERNSERKLPPLWDSKSHHQPYPPVLPTYAEAEEAFTRGMRRSRSLLSEITPGRSDTQSQKSEMTREDFLKEIRSAETFLTEIMSRKHGSASTNLEKDESLTNTPESPEYESVCIVPDSSQTIRFQSEKPPSATDGCRENATEAIYAQVTKRSKRTEIKVRPEIPVLQIGSNNVTADTPSLEQGKFTNATSPVNSPAGKLEVCDALNSLTNSEIQSQSKSQSQSDGFVFSEIMPKNGLLLDQISPGMKEDSVPRKASPVGIEEREAEARLKLGSTEQGEGVSKDSSTLPDFSGGELKSRQGVELSRQSEVQSLSQDGVTEVTTDSLVESNKLDSHPSTNDIDGNGQMTAGEKSSEITEALLEQSTVIPGGQTLKADDSILHGLKTDGWQADQRIVNDDFSKQSGNIPSHMDVSSIGLSSKTPDSLNETRSQNLSQHSSVSDKSVDDRVLKKDMCPEIVQKKEITDIMAHSQTSNIEAFSKINKISNTPQIDAEIYLGIVGHDSHPETECKIKNIDAYPQDFLSPLGDKGTDMTPLPLVLDPTSELSFSVNTPTDSAMSPLTSSSLDCLTPGDPWGGGGTGWRALGTDTPYRDSAYFSDSDWEGEGANRRSGDGVNLSRPSSSRSGERGMLMGIEERAEVEEEGETEGETLRKEVNRTKDQMEGTLTSNEKMAVETEREIQNRWTENKKIAEISAREKEPSLNVENRLRKAADLEERNIGLIELAHDTEMDSKQKEFTEISSNLFERTKGTDPNLKELDSQALFPEKTQTEGSAEFIAKLFSTLDCQPLKDFSYNDGNEVDYKVYSHIDNYHNMGDKAQNDSFIDLLSDGKTKEIIFQDPVEKDFKSVCNAVTEKDSLRGIPGSEIYPGMKDNEQESKKEFLTNASHLNFKDKSDKDLILPEYHEVNDDGQQGLPSYSSPDNRESRLCRFYNVVTSETGSKDKFDSVLEPNHEGHTDKTKVHISQSYWGERIIETPTRKDANDSEVQHQDANELGLRNLCYSEHSNDERANSESETEKQLAAGELCYTIQENLDSDKQDEGRAREMLTEVSPRASFIESLDMESKGLQLKAKELWNAMEEEEEGTGGAVRGELDCYRFKKGDLHLWPAENDQWASAEPVNQEVELGTELFSGFNRDTWRDKEDVALGRGFWEVEENDELAGSEPHPSVFSSCQDTVNDERQGQADFPHIDTKFLEMQSMPSQASGVMESQLLTDHGHGIQQEENVENPDLDVEGQEIREECTILEVENLENPVQESLTHTKNEDSHSGTGRDFEIQKGDTESPKMPYLQHQLEGDFAEENQNFNRCSLPADGNQKLDVVRMEENTSCLHSFNHSKENQVTHSDVNRDLGVDCMENSQILGIGITEENAKDQFCGVKDLPVTTENINSSQSICFTNAFQIEVDADIVANVENEVLNKHQGEPELSCQELLPVETEDKKTFENSGKEAENHVSCTGPLNSTNSSDSCNVQGLVPHLDSVKEDISNDQVSHTPSVTESQTNLLANMSQSPNSFHNEVHCMEIKDVSDTGLFLSHTKTESQTAAVAETQEDSSFAKKQVEFTSSETSTQIENYSQILSSSTDSSNVQEKTNSKISEVMVNCESNQLYSEGVQDCEPHRDSGLSVLQHCHQNTDILSKVETTLQSEHSPVVVPSCTSTVTLGGCAAPQESSGDFTQNKGTSANLEASPVPLAQICRPTNQQNLCQPCSVGQNEENTISQKLSLPSFSQCSLTSIPELLISEWKDLDEEPLEDFEKLEQLCRISGDEGTLGDLFLENLELLESLKKTPEQKSKGSAEMGMGKETSSTWEGERTMHLKGEAGGVSESFVPTSDNADQLLRSRLYQQPDGSQEMVPGPSSLVQSPFGEVKPGSEERSLASPCHPSEKNVGQRSLSKMPAKNGLMMQVCEERLQYSLSENVKKNVLWGSPVSESVVLRPWSDPITEGGDRPREKDSQSSDHKEEPQPAAHSAIFEEPFVATRDPLTLAGHEAEITPPLVVSNQAMKAKLARLSLSLPPLALSLPLSPSPRVGFWEGGGNRERGGRRRGASTGSDPDEEDEEEQEEEGSRRVIVVTETDVDRRVGLRSSLKSPREPTEREKERGRNVSFFDDVTVYLFDQETPTNELSTGSVPTSPSPSQDESRTASSIEALASGAVESRESDDLSINPKMSGANSVTSRFTVSPAHDPHLV
ncbi:uncharacterized protein si:dkey-40m6.8 isoform X2 [Megalops cyprinoides]|uniref:uncharacterized protein si:dkey-40m6.8 isoform X2 n=1 Tax=Megalops cyprinoides TaxID=118141 RepID=UPI0018650FC2|nr:uncharacterized protein si:dkey-40m6.8 isoform X2 [Megalops cyprinoides]